MSARDELIKLLQEKRGKRNVARQEIETLDAEIVALESVRDQIDRLAPIKKSLSELPPSLQETK